MKEPENPRIRLVPRKAREAKIEVQEEKRSVLGRLCYVSIILLLLSSSICGVYMLVYGIDPTEMSSFQNFDVIQSLEKIGGELKRMKLPQFELGAESLMPNFLGSELSLPSKETMNSVSSSMKEQIQSIWTSVSALLGTTWSSLATSSSGLTGLSDGLLAGLEATRDHVETFTAGFRTVAGQQFSRVSNVLSTYTTAIMETLMALDININFYVEDIPSTPETYLGEEGGSRASMETPKAPENVPLTPPGLSIEEVSQAPAESSVQSPDATPTNAQSSDATPTNAQSPDASAATHHSKVDAVKAPVANAQEPKKTEENASNEDSPKHNIPV